jgi:hypothetical protein
MDIFEVGIVLTIFLAAITGVFVYADGIPDVDFFDDAGTLAPIVLLTQQDVNNFRISSQNAATSSGLLAIVAWGDFAVTALGFYGKFIFSSLFGYIAVFELITVPLGLGVLGDIFGIALSAIILYTLAIFGMKVYSVVRGGGPGG